jgi:hypothetical protein
MDPRHRALIATGFHTGAGPRSCSPSPCAHPGADPRRGSPSPRAHHDGDPRRGSPSPRAHHDGDPRHGSPSTCAHRDGFSPRRVFTPARVLGPVPRLRALTSAVIPGMVPRLRALTATGIHNFHTGAGPRSPFPVSARSPRRAFTIFTPARFLGHRSPSPRAHRDGLSQFSYRRGSSVTVPRLRVGKKYDLSLLLDLVLTWHNRCSFERVIACCRKNWWSQVF